MNEESLSELEKMDMLRERIGIGYAEARDALNSAQGDVYRALDSLEEQNKGQKFRTDARDCGSEAWQNLKTKMQDLNRTKINLKKDDTTYLSLSAPLGIALAYAVWRRPGLRMLALAGIVGAAMNHFEWELDSLAKPSAQAGDYASGTD